MRAGGVDDVSALDGALIGPDSGNAAVLKQDFFDACRGRETHAQLAALVFVSLHDAAWRHVTVARAPKDGARGGKIHQWPPAFGFLCVDERRLQSSGIRRLFE